MKTNMCIMFRYVCRARADNTKIRYRILYNRGQACKFFLLFVMRQVLEREYNESLKKGTFE